MVNDKRLKISIVTPNYNYSHYIGATVQSVVNQDYDNWEHIIVDDGSTDKSVQVISTYVNRFPNKIKLICQSNKGQSSAVNVALANVTGDIIGWINSDDFYEHDIFAKIVNTFNANPDIDAVFGDIGIVDENGDLVKINKYSKFNYVSGVFNGFGKIISSNAIFWKKKLTDEIGFVNENYTYSMDSEYWSRLLYNRKVLKIGLIIAYFRWHSLAKTIIRKEKGSVESDLATAEYKNTMKNSYENLWISTILPFKLSYPIYLFYRLRRYVLRSLAGHYFSKEKR